jgi:hypothetical protein
MALDATEVRSFGFGHGYVADVGAVEPATITAPVDLGEGWVELGHITDAGPRFSFGKSRTPISSWQAGGDPVRILKGAAATTVSYDLEQWNRWNLPLALGDSGTWAESAPSSGLWTYTPGEKSDVDERALIIEASDGVYDYRFIFRRTENQANVDFAFTGTALAPLPVVATVLQGPGGLKPYIIQTNDPNISVANASA